MLGWSIVFRGPGGYRGLLWASSAWRALAATVAKVLFLIFLVLLVLSFVVRALRGDSVV